ncbi:hypothetical protein ACMX2H_16640 [Arthrobacter sulfonylureivorans]|uniref:DUF4190 domain-containing protein n=1 Tax=Arthrobacter sulfonylureivorans TaxID=2486855 RepID=UPI0039E564A8
MSTPNGPGEYPEPTTSGQPQGTYPAYPQQAPGQQAYPQQGPGQQAYPQQNAPYGYPGQPVPGQPVPGKTMGIVGFVLSLLGPLTVAGLIVSIIGMVQSKRANAKNGFALAGIIIGAVGTVLLILFTIITIAGIAYMVEVCSELGPGTHFQDGVTYTCS